MPFARRKILQAAALTGFALAGYSFNRGIRLPTLHWGPIDLAKRFKINAVGEAAVTDLILTSTQPEQHASFRAYAPEPKLTLEISQPGEYIIGVGNIAQDSVLNATDNANIIEQKNGINRTLTINARAKELIDLSWVSPKLESYTFASIGDTGGSDELAWCLKRAHDLNARFLLHLGDFNYQPGDYQETIRLFRNSPIPVYVSIGNHDFHTDGAIYGDFIQEIGPLNNSFAIGNTRFVNIDTAANILPYGAGQRGTMLQALAGESGFADTVAFTHRPLHDPLENSHHDIGSDGERDWLIEQLKNANVNTLLSGHIHIFDRRNFDGIDNIIAGQGLGHQDLIVNDNKHSKMVLGSVDSQGKVSYQTAPLLMPMKLHCHPRIDPVKQSLLESDHAQLIQQINTQCEHNRQKN